MSNLMKYLTQYRELLTESLTQTLREAEVAAPATGQVPTEVWRVLHERVAAGKLLRGCLTAMATEAFGGDVFDGIKLGAAWELLNNALLIHDDIIDRDEVRRGQPSVFAYYTRQAEQNQCPQAPHVGQSLALCVGDICFFLANQLLADTRLDGSTTRAVIKRMSQEMMFTAFGEMKDTIAGYDTRQLSDDEIRAIFIEKTARYSFVLPLVSAALISQQTSAVVRDLEKLGEALGVLFQIKDDELGLFGSSEQIGKPAGSDLREGKQTLYFWYARQLVTHEDWQRVMTLVGKSDLGEGDLTFVRQLVIDSGAKAKVDQELFELETSAHELITRLPLTEEWRELFYDLVAWQLKRLS